MFILSFCKMVGLNHCEYYTLGYSKDPTILEQRALDICGAEGWMLTRRGTGVTFLWPDDSEGDSYRIECVEEIV